MYALEKKNVSPLYIQRMSMPQVMPLSTLTLVHTWYEDSTRWAYMWHGPHTIAL